LKVETLNVIIFIRFEFKNKPNNWEFRFYYYKPFLAFFTTLAEGSGLGGRMG
jgi:hypothetical protein